MLSKKQNILNSVMNELNLFKHIFCFENKSFQISIDFVFPSNSFNGNFLSAMIFRA